MPGFYKVNSVNERDPRLVVILLLLVDMATYYRRTRSGHDVALGYRGLERYWNWNSGNNRVRCSPDWSVYRCIERYCMTPRQREDDNNLSVGNRNHLKLGIEPESWLQSHELGF